MEKKISENSLLIIMGLLILVESANLIYSCFVYPVLAILIIRLVALIFVVLYGFWLYKKPHGNMLKYAMLLSALSIVISAIMSLYQWDDPFYEAFLPIFAACLLFYVAGRLNRIDQNKYLLPIIVVILFACCIIDWISFSGIPVAVSIYFRVTWHFITVLTLTIAYFVRYKEHKEAGLADAPKK